jgi:hypothetical protein
VRRLAAVLTAIVLGLAVSACGSDNDAAPTPEPEQQASEPTPDGGEAAAPAGVAERPGCGQLCQQAGPPAGTDNPGCPGNDSDNCAPCPEGGCAELLTGSAAVQDGIFTIDMACNVDHPCVGALHLYVPGSIGSPVAASDVSVPPGETATLPIALTTFGRHVVGVKGDFEGSVYVFLQGTGVDQLGAGAQDPTAPTLRLSATPGELLPCDGEIQVAPTTTCAFAENVFTAYGEAVLDYGGSSSMGVEAHSPVTGRSYQMRCYSDAYARGDTATVYCTGGDDAFVTFPEERR